MTPMELEFKNLANVKAEPSRFVSANLQVVSMNIAKNDDDGDDGDQTWVNYIFVCKFCKKTRCFQEKFNIFTRLLVVTVATNSKSG